MGRAPRQSGKGKPVAQSKRMKLSQNVFEPLDTPLNLQYSLTLRENGKVYTHKLELSESADDDMPMKYKQEWQHAGFFIVAPAI